MASRIFLLSPANAGGERAQLTLRKGATFELARKVQSKDGAPLGDIFRFTSGLYFRGKLAYATRFAAPPLPQVPGTLVITPGAGLLPPETLVNAARLRAFAKVDIHEDNLRFRRPLLRDAKLIKQAAGGCEVVLLGSIASGKYTEVLLDVFGDQLVFPESFVGRGDMSRGGLLLRCVRSGEELTYVKVNGAVLHGKRPPKLQRMGSSWAAESRASGIEGLAPSVVNRQVR